MDLNLDTTRLMANRPPKAFNNLEVTDLDPLGVGSTTYPRAIEVQTPNADGAKLLAMWTGFPVLTVGDTVVCWRDSTDTSLLRVASSGGSTSGLQKISELWESDGGAVAAQTDASGNLTLNGTRDIFPQASVNGLNARFERLFGDDKPADTYKFTQRTFAVNNFANHIAGFEDSQASPYSFGGSPGGFSINVGAGEYIRSNDFAHFLTLGTALPATGNTYLQWTDATGLNAIDIMSALYINIGIGEGIYGELRVWPDDAASLTANSRWASIRWQWQPTTFPDLPMRIEGWYSTAAGDGLTFAAATGTKYTSISIPTLNGAVYRYTATISVSGNIFTLGQYNAEGLLAAAQGVVLPFTFAKIKTARFYLLAGSARSYIDQITIT